MLDMEVFAISQNDAPVNHSIVRLVQRAGPATSFAQICREVEAFVDRQKINIPDSKVAADMKNALFKGLGDRLPLSHVTNDGMFEDT
jgi:hypothetical protein